MLRIVFNSTVRASRFPGTAQIRTFHVSSARMDRKCGIVGMPNVGKSLLFNALHGRALAQSANYPFTTIKPNIGVVAVPDLRVRALGELIRPHRVTPPSMEVYDIAGLIKGAAQGTGLGNQFLNAVQGVDLIVHLVRCFEATDGNVPIAHVEGEVDPQRDIAIIHHELIAKDLEHVTRLQSNTLRIKTTMDHKWLRRVLDECASELHAGHLLRNKQHKSSEERALIESLGLLTAKPMVVCLNVDERDLTEPNERVHQVTRWLESEHRVSVVPLSVRLEYELASVKESALRSELMTLYHMAQLGTEQLVHACYRALDMLTFYTMNKNEVRAWPVPRGLTAKQCAHHVHSDMYHGFIRVEVVSADDVLRLGLKRARDEGKFRTEGAQYLPRDGDVLLFKFRE